MSDYWERVKGDDRLRRARQKLSFDELRMLFQHARDSLGDTPKPNGETIRLTADIVPYSSIVGGGLVLKKLNGQACFILNFIGTTEGVTKSETVALAQQFSWFVNTYGVYVPPRSTTPVSEQEPAGGRP